MTSHSFKVWAKAVPEEGGYYFATTRAKLKSEDYWFFDDEQVKPLGLPAPEESDGKPIRLTITFKEPVGFKGRRR